jgi:hypothetical protein
MKAAVKKFADILDDVGMFLLTWACVFASPYVLALKAGTGFTVDLSLWRILVALIPATLVTGVIELKGIVNADSLEAAAKAKEGRRRNAWMRIIIAILCGIAWPTITDKLLALLGVGA